MQVVTQTLAIWGSVIEKAEAPEDMAEETKQALDAAAAMLKQNRDQLGALSPQMDEVMHQGNTLALRIQNTLLTPPEEQAAEEAEPEQAEEEKPPTRAAKRRAAKAKE